MRDKNVCPGVKLSPRLFSEGSKNVRRRTKNEGGKSEEWLERKESFSSEVIIPSFQRRKKEK